MDAAFNDETQNADRVFRLTHNSSGQKLYMRGMVTELKKNRGTLDKVIAVKAKIALQDGSAEYNPA
jgi:hypothetical protein